MKIIAYIGSAILIFFGILFIWSAFSPQGSPSSIIIGIITLAVAFTIIFIVSRKSTQGTASTTNVTLNLDLPGKTNLASLKCQSCGGNLRPENITMVAGAPVVNCPFCGTTYQLTEEPKW